MAVLIAVGMPDLAEQEAAGLGPPPAQPPTWPWPGDALNLRLAEARGALKRLASELGPEILPGQAMLRTHPAIG